MNNIKYVTYEDTVFNRMTEFGYYSPRIVGVLPAHNEEDSIADVLKSLSEQVIPNDLKFDLFIALDNCSDNTEKVIIEANKQYKLNIYLLKTVNNTQRKVGAMNQIYQLFWGNPSDPEFKNIGNNQQKYVDSIVAFVGVDADVYLAKNCIKTLWNELQKNHKTGSVSANYTSLLPESPKKLLRNDPNREQLIKQGKFGGWFAKWITFCQNLEFTSWTIKQKYAGHFAEICGGQCSIFRPKATKEVHEKYKLNGLYDDKSDTEDLLLTQQLRACGWECLISDSARCYVDSMKNLHSYSAQRNKWVSGTIDYMLQDWLKTKYSRRLWLQESNLMINFVLRILFVVLLSTAILTDQFVWSWIWISPVIAASLLNFILAVKTPNHRVIDVIGATLLISPEVYLWMTLAIHINVWISRLRVSKKDGWANQYAAENGQTRSKFVLHLLLACGAILGIVWVVKDKYNYIASESTRVALKPYLEHGFMILTLMTIFEFVLMIHQIWKLRAPYKA